MLLNNRGQDLAYKDSAQSQQEKSSSSHCRLSNQEKTQTPDLRRSIVWPLDSGSEGAGDWERPALRAILQTWRALTRTVTSEAADSAVDSISL